MGIVYFGDVERVSRELAEIKDALDARYMEILGEEAFRRLDETSRRVLNNQSFYGDPTRFYKATGSRIRGPNKFIVASDKSFELDRTGSLREAKIRTSPLFYISEEGFQNSGSASFTDRRIVSHIHEFDHYIWYALQRVPIYLVSVGISTNLGIGPGTEDVIQYLESLGEKDLSPDEWLLKIYLANLLLAFEDNYERTNNVLDNMVFESIGIKRELPWRGKPRTYKILNTLQRYSHSCADWRGSKC